MAEDFEVGDVVVCINDAPCDVYKKSSGVRRGAIYRICEVKTAVDRYAGLQQGARIPETGDKWHFAKRRFRKLPKADETFAAEMRALKPRRVREPA